MSLLDAFLEEGVVVQASKREIHLAIRRDGPAQWTTLDPHLGDGSRANPFDASSSEKLDDILNPRRIPPIALPNTRFIFGPGNFRTRGGPGYGGDGPYGWSVLDGQEFVGSGMYSTILRLEVPPDPPHNSGYPAISNDYGANAHGVIIADMTIGCAQEDQPKSPGYSYSATCTAAIALFAGDHLRIRRVRIINFGINMDDSTAGPLVITNTVPFKNAVIENCIIEQPYHSNHRDMAAINVNGAGWNVCAAIRHNLVDMAMVNQGPYPRAPIQGLDVGNLAIDNNWVDGSSADLPVQRGTANYVQAFNNRTLTGDLLPVAITASGASALYRHQGELTTDAELLYAEL